jgi:hypothetical protein
MVSPQDEDATVIRLRRCAASAGQVRLRRLRLRGLAATAGQVAATAGQVRLGLATALFVALAGGTGLLACPLCFGAEETPLIDGAKLGVLVMLGVLFAVQGAFVAFFLYLRRRAKQNADIELDLEWSEFQRGSRTL